MDAKSVGACIARLRKKAGYTQASLAAKLNISDKTVSRWESGLGYPEVTQFPTLANIFGVTVDYLMAGERKGITIAGNILTDLVKTIECYPKIGMLSNISRVTQAVGGCAANTAIDLAKIDRNMPVSVIAKIGNDEYGRYLLSELKKYDIYCNGISISSESPTSFSDVMSCSSGERTFFHARGANAEFSPEDVDISTLNCVIFHIGYILLLDEFDKPDAEYGTVMARFLCELQNRGIKTSVDVVSDSQGDYKAKVLPALKYCNYVIVNELESGLVSGLEPYYPDGNLNIENIEKSMRYMAECGVKDKVIVHCKKAGFCLDVATGEFTMVSSLQIPKEAIKGSVGAGDAFCAGCLYGLYHDYDDMRLMEFASAAAACNLFADNSVDGMLSKREIDKLPEKYGRREL